MVDILWLVLLSTTGLYEILPGFICSLVIGVAVTLFTPAPSYEVEALFNQGVLNSKSETK